MGRPKKITKATEPKKECKKKMVEKFRCTIRKQWKDFNNQDDAREMALSVLQTNKVFFLTLEKVEVEKKDC